MIIIQQPVSKEEWLFPYSTLFFLYKDKRGVAVIEFLKETKSFTFKIENATDDQIAAAVFASSDGSIGRLEGLRI